MPILQLFGKDGRRVITHTAAMREVDFLAMDERDEHRIRHCRTPLEFVRAMVWCGYLTDVYWCPACVRWILLPGQQPTWRAFEADRPVAADDARRAA